MVPIRAAQQYLSCGCGGRRHGPRFSWAVTRSGDASASSAIPPIGRVLRDMLAVAPIEARMIVQVENHP